MRALLFGVLVVLLAPKEPDVPAPGGLWKRLPPPQPGEWRWTFHEEDQTLAEYKEAGPVRGTPERERIYLLPFLTRPPRDERLLENLALALEGYYGRSVEALRPRPLPAGAYVRERRQVSVLRLAPALVAALPEDALFLLAVTDRDLFAGDLPQAYGWGSFRERVGVMSTYRLGAGAAATRRAVTLAAHEAGHMLSLPHCAFFGCLMNGARTLEEADRRPALFCPVCREKVCWNLGLDAPGRYARLEEALRALGLTADAALAAKAADVTRTSAEG